jgi:hypothetical protein
MISLLLSVALIAALPADDPAAAIPGRGDRTAARQCLPRLGQRADGDVLGITVDRASRSGSVKTIRGTIHIGQRPVSGPPGTLTPAHIVNISFQYRCSLRHGRPVKTQLVPLGS